jgi:hypothetical protein
MSNLNLAFEVINLMEQTVVDACISEPVEQLNASLTQMRIKTDKQIENFWQKDKERRDYFAFLKKLHHFNQQMFQMYANNHTVVNAKYDMRRMMTLAHASPNIFSIADAETEKVFKTNYERYCYQSNREYNANVNQFSSYLQSIAQSPVYHTEVD